ncbi:family 78 glycoside hydrolase catalytic domain [Schumannella luteola]
MSTISRFRAELREDSPIVATATPRLTWSVATDERDWMQSSAELRSGDESVVLDGPESVLVEWPFAPLEPGERRTVSVRATAASGSTTEWSEPLEIVAGFLAEGVWRAQPIGLAAPTAPAQPALLRTAFSVEREVSRATLYYTALGVIDAELNGTAVDDGVMAPGWTSYRDRLVHETTDVTALVTRGENVLGLRLAGAWYTEQYGFFEFASRVYGEQPAALAQLELEFADGSRETVVTDGSWRASGEALTASSLYDGEAYDARLEQRGWSAPGFDDSAWSAAAVLAVDAPTPEARIAEPVRRIDELPVVEVLESPSGQLVLDFGQNLVGRLRVRVTGPAGTELTLRHAEVLEHGELALRPLRRAAATDTYVLRGDPAGEEWEPRFTFHGFRYAQIDGWPGEFDASAVTAVVLHSDLRRTGWFESSEPLLNRLHENVVWGMRGNFLSIPTDCPQRDERLGWTGDIQVFTPTASFLYDCDGFLTSWLRDLALEQSRAGGVTPLVVPSVLPAFGGATAAWGDATTVVPWVLHERFGDRGVLRDQYDSMRAWADVLLAESRGTGLWAGTFQLGDWLDPAAPPDKPQQARTHSDIVASAYLARSLRIVADTAALLGHDDDAQRYGEHAEHARAAFVAEYVTPAGRMMSDAQTAYALALQFDLVTDPEQRAALAARLAEIVREDGYRIGTGFVGTPLVADALASAGRTDAAGRLLLQTENPSWLYPVTMGATTVWERWDSLLPDGSVNPGEMTSFNHYALGAIADWMHRTVAGLGPDAAGYRRLRIAPRPLRQLGWASASHETPYGLASVSWTREGSTVSVVAVVPANTTAVVDLPGHPLTEVGSGEHRFSFEEAPVPERTTPLGLDSSVAAIIDDERAYRAVVDAIAAIDPDRAATFRTETVWAERRSLRQSLLFTPPAVFESIERALADL